MDWTCPPCGKTFKRKKQGHKCFSGGCPELAGCIVASYVVTVQAGPAKPGGEPA